MIQYSLNPDGMYANKIVDGIATGEWIHTEANPEYLAWLAEGNAPAPYVPPPTAPEPTIEEKLASVGLSIDDLKTALGIK